VQVQHRVLRERIGDLKVDHRAAVGLPRVQLLLLIPDLLVGCQLRRQNLQTALHHRPRAIFFEIWSRRADDPRATARPDVDTLRRERGRRAAPPRDGDHDKRDRYRDDQELALTASRRRVVPPITAARPARARARAPIDNARITYKF
jgi:hypothetical protein